VRSGSPVRRAPLAAAVLAAALAAAGPGGARAAPPEVKVAFDADLVRPDDRGAYERTLREMVADARARVVAGVGMEPAPRTEVRVHSRAGFEARFGGEAAGRDAARYEGDVIHLNGGARLDDRVAGLLVHELTHAALDAGGRARSLPRWLDEGLARRLEMARRGLSRPAPSQAAELRQARDAGRLVPLPREGELDPLGYLRAWAAVAWMEDRFGRDRVLAVVKATLAGEPFGTALRRETGLSEDDLDAAFSAWVGKT
jgi:hypothetical protein